MIIDIKYYRKQKKLILIYWVILTKFKKVDI